MLKQSFFYFILAIFLFSCNNPSVSTGAQSSEAAVESPISPTSTAPAESQDVNENTVDDAAAERIKNYLVNSFLKRDIPLMEESDKQFQLYRIDLNGDGTNEYVVRFNSSYFCGGDRCTVLLLNNNLTIISNGKYPADPSTITVTAFSPTAQDALLFASNESSKTYRFSEKPIQQMQKGMARRNSVFQRTYNAGSFLFKVNATNSEVTPIHVTTEGLPRAYNETFEIEGALREGHLLDLNKDGFKELYLITQPTDDSGNFDIMGIASYRDKSAGAIYVKDTPEKRKVNSDKVFVEEGELRRSFVQNGNPMNFKYRLRTGETGFILEAVKM